MSAPRHVERFETIVIGAGQAGLSAGYHLAERDVDFAILTDEEHVGDNWRRRWDSLRLFTPAGYSGLPGMPFPALPSELPDKDQVADYLERYAERFDLPVRLGTRVESLGWDGERYVLRTSRSNIEADSVVIATGAFQAPRVPVLASRLSPRIHQIHSSEYRNPFDLPDGPALVVGAGNSGAQIAVELARFRKVWLAGRNTGHLPRRFLGRDLFQWIWPILTRATADTRLGRRIRENVRSGGDALIGIPERTIADAGVDRVGRVTDERGGLPVCDADVVTPSVIVWCTGFEPDYRWIDLPIFAQDGYPRHERGVVPGAPGLYFTGLRFQYRLTSSLIGGAGLDAEFIAEQIARRAEAGAVA
ncbi:MAG TPA: NAD(P)-binding domain-containing protein [Gemmatimonadaceae bacterium]|nr:NAD(P)-binding domain-containing protein [Gemmatimonadaceae bacterium]